MEFNARTLHALEKKKIYNEHDLLRRLPRAYKDYRELKDISNCIPGKNHAVLGVLRGVSLKMGARKYLSLHVESGEGARNKMFNVLLFSRTFLEGFLTNMIDQEIVVTGKVTFDEIYGYQMTEPDGIMPRFKFKAGIVPVYSKVKGISSDNYMAIVDKALSEVCEPFEWELMQKTKCIDYKTALYCCHRPRNEADIITGKKRIAINDLLYFSMGLKAGSKTAKTSNMKFKEKNSFKAFLEILPFDLTEDQDRVIKNICSTCASGRRLNTLLYGDVGSGKTVVAASLLMLSKVNGYQSVLMAPRGVLAGQHYKSILELTGLSEDEVIYLHSGLKAAERRNALKKIKDGTASIIVGTHSCIAETVEYKNLGAVIVDEEHLFGVKQKEAMAQKAKDGVHVLSMSATPIPRTLATVMYGTDRVIEELKMLPKGRKPIKTTIIANRRKVLPFLLKEIQLGHQCYVVCPAIEDNEETALVSVEKMLEIYGEYFRSNNITFSAVTGNLNPKEAAEIMKDFADGKTKVLVSTTVVEVGVNVPNATVIVVEQAERFGLASLHQLRGRVGRGTNQSYCILRSDETKNERLKVIESTTNGMDIAEADLKQRGSGDLLGTKQAGDNYFVEQMIARPELFKEICNLADWCIEKNMGKGLVSIYDHGEI